MRKGIISFLFIAVALGVFLVWTRPQMKEVGGLKLDKAAINEALANSQELQQARDKLLSQYNSIPQTNLTKITQILPATAEETKLMVEFSNIAQSSGVILESFQTRELSSSGQEINGAASAKQYQEIAMDISFSASYEGMIAFLQSIEKSLRLVDIDEISFSAGEEDAYSISLTAKAYFKGE